MPDRTGFEPRYPERAQLEPATSGLQTHPNARRHLTLANETRMAEPNLIFLSNNTRHRSTAFRSHRARPAAA
jgi:hypothetical protein